MAAYGIAHSYNNLRPRGQVSFHYFSIYARAHTVRRGSMPHVLFFNS